jgi:3-oxoacyl-[acyl-carrier protein] reductase
MGVQDRECLVTGAAGGIGRASAELLADRGATIVVVDQNDRDSGKLVAGLEGADRALFVMADVTRLADLDRVVTGARQAFGRIDVLVNCVGIASLTRLPEITAEEWDRVFAVNLRSVFFLTQRVMAHMVERRSGTIICILSASAKIGSIAVGPYHSASALCLAASKCTPSRSEHVTTGPSSNGRVLCAAVIWLVSNTSPLEVK